MKNLIPIVFTSVIIVIFTLALIYLSRRFAGYFSSERTILYFLCFATITVFMIYGVLALSNTTEQIGHLAYIIAAILMGFILYLLLSVIVVDILKIFINIPTKSSATIVLGLTTIISIYGVWNSSYIRTTNVDIPIKNLSQEIKALHLSDIHIGHFRGEKTIKTIINKANMLKPDIIFITGDFFDGKIGIKDEIFNAIKNFTAPIYFVEGNHDEYTNIALIKRKLIDVGVKVLENKIENFADLQIVGINHMKADRNSFDMHASEHKPTIEETLIKLPIDNTKPSILLHHSPEGIEYANKHGIDLYLSGHTHAGQLFPINIIANYLFSFNRGLHNYKDTKIFVSEGVGTFGPPMRVGTRSEMILLTLKPNK